MTATRAFPVLLALLLVPACVSTSGDPCQDLIDDVAACTGDDPAELAGLCELDPDEAAGIADAACAGGDGKQDGQSGGNVDGDSCFNFDFECDSGLICRPVDAEEAEHQCLVPGAWDDWCDDDSDCANGVACLGETSSGAGRCRDLIPPGGRCTNFDWECEGEHVCRPADELETDHFCLPVGHRYELCDDDSDCAGDLICTSEIAVAGRCMPG